MAVVTRLHHVSDAVALRALAGLTSQRVVLDGYYAFDDPGGSALVWDSTPAKDDGCLRFNVGGLGSSSAGWRRIIDRTLEISVAWAGASPAASRATNRDAFNAAFAAIGSTPIVSPNVNISQHVSIVGEGEQITSLSFDAGGILATDYPGGNTSSQVHVRDLGLYNTSASNTHAGLFYQGAADCVIERCRIAGFLTAIDTLDCNTMTIRDIVFAACAGGVPALIGGVPTSIGVGLRGSANQLRVRDCQFNGPGINVLHGGGAGNFVSGCNSEGGVLGWFTGVNVCVHEGWTTEGQDATQTPYLFYFDDGGSMGNVDVADGVLFRDCFLGGSATRDIVRLAPHATINNIGWERMTIAAQPPGGVFQGCQVPNHIGNACYSIGRKVAPAPNTGPLFDHTPAQYKDLTA